MLKETVETPGENSIVNGPGLLVLTTCDHNEELQYIHPAAIAVQFTAPIMFPLNGLE